MTDGDDKRVKVLVITSIDTTLVVLLWAQLRALRVAGYDVRCACLPGPNKEWLEAQGVAYVDLDIHRSVTPWADLKVLWQLIRYLRREKVTIVHTHTPKAALLGQLAGRLAGVPVIVNTLHGFYFHDQMGRTAKIVYVAIARLGGWCATMTLSQNPEDVETAMRLNICRTDRIRLLGNGIDLGRFDPSRFDAAFRRRKRAELGIEERALVVGMIGRLVVDKGYVELFEAMRTLVSSRDGVHLLMIAPEEPHRSGRLSVNEYERYGLAGHTTHLSGSDCIDELMACMDVYVLPSWREGFPRSAIEAAAMGLPIVTTNVRGCRQVVTHDENGFLVSTRSPDELATAIGRLLDDPSLRTRFGLAGRRRAEREFDEKKVCDVVLDTYVEQLEACGLTRPMGEPTLDASLPVRGPFLW